MAYMLLVSIIAILFGLISSYPQNQFNLAQSNTTGPAGALYLCGGWDGVNHLTKCLVFKAETQKWEDTHHNLALARADLQVVALNNELYAIGGDTEPDKEVNLVEVLRNNKWTQIASLNTKRYYSGATVLNNGIYICGGHANKKYLKSCESYTSQSQKWQFIADMPEAKEGFGLVANDGHLYAVGGAANNDFNSVHKFDTSSHSWSKVASLLRSRSYGGTAVLNGNIYTCGGYDQDCLSTCEMYDTKANKWHSIASMGHKRGWFSLVAYDNKLYALGGYDCPNQLNTVEVYDPTNNKWSKGPTLPAKLDHYGAAVLNN